jgi:hypothetical protein
MSIIKDWNKLHIDLKAFVLCVCAIMPFWYLGIFIFKNEIINGYPFFVSVVISYCLSLLTFLCIYNVIGNFMDKRNPNNSKTYVQFMSATFVSICSISLFYLCIKILLFRMKSIRIFGLSSFSTMVIFYFCFLLGFFIFASAWKDLYFSDKETSDSPESDNSQL